jgi:hypothetical protein
MENFKGQPMRLGDFEEERRKIVSEYAKGNYIKTSADEMFPGESKAKKSLKAEEKGENDGNKR